MKLLGNFIPDIDGEINLNQNSILFLIVFIFLSSLLLIFIFNKISKNKIRLLYGIILGLSILEPLFEIIDIFEEYDGMYRLLVIVFTTIIVCLDLIFIYVYIKGLPLVIFRNYGIIMSSVIIGRQIAIMIDLKLLVFALLLLSVFDIYSVFKGPLAKVIGKPRKIIFTLPTSHQQSAHIKKICEQGTPVYITNYSMLGIGDTLFFSVLIVKSYILFGLGAMLLVFIAISLGTMLTLIILKRISPLPALPLPVLLSLIVFSIYYIF